MNSIKTSIISTALLLSWNTCLAHAVATADSCQFNDLFIDTSYDTAAVAGCERLSSDSFRLFIEPETDPINPSPWYGFKLSTNDLRHINIELNYSEYKHRYHPQLSRDGINWSPLEEHNIVVSEDRHTATLKLEVAADPIWISAQEIITPEMNRMWLKSLMQRADHTLVETDYGQSVEGRTLSLMSTQDEQQPFVLVLAGRQHPPEVTGALAMQSFVEQLLLDSEDSQAFLSCAKIIVAPMMNPDGVVHGYWRTNINQVDLNRDWGIFDQPETSSFISFVENELTQRKLMGLIDFHSTHNDLFYTPVFDSIAPPYNYLASWFTTLDERLIAKGITHDLNIKPIDGGNPNTSRGYTSRVYKVPGVTFEIGDHSDRAFIDTLAREAADAYIESTLGLCSERQS